ncbi:unnamed protein product [Arabis nemorensis]|uniref:Methionyl-tRNA synthetase anticodon-binding domain-containing protein n=1 Tax=Arabis nemorensis TaxID=586526 RepID=A0A565AN32_9BRAS|nr:unnamed protein product [Arabis nemorensis]
MQVKLKERLKKAMLISREGNQYLTASRFWRLYEEDKPCCALVIRSAAGLVHLLAQLLEPFMLSFSREVFFTTLGRERRSLTSKKTLGDSAS